MQLQPYLFFEGRAEEAIEFYKQALGAKVDMMMRFKESPEPTMAPPGSDDKIMHASITMKGATMLLSDGLCNQKPSFSGFSLSLLVDTPEEAKQCFTALEAGGQVQMPLSPTFFSPMFGMVADKFGVSWMVLVYKVP